MIIKVGFFSDLHLEFAKYRFPLDMLPEADIWINAGDTHSDSEVRKSFDDFMKHHCDKVNVNYRSILGNHDVYGSGNFLDTTPINISYAHVVRRFNLGTERQSIKIMGCTLWTATKNQKEFEDKVENYLNDSVWIAEYNYNNYKHVHDYHVEHIAEHENTQIIFTHHLPSFQSIHPKYAMMPNTAFASDLDDLIIKVNPKLWIHGHTHDSTDYHIGDTRIVCHPRGYPGEANHKDYMPRIVEFEI